MPDSCGGSPRAPVPACYCVVCAGEPDSHRAGPVVARRGWDLVVGNAGAHSLGLWHSYRSAEVAIFGRSVSESMMWLARVAEAAAAGRLIRPDVAEDDVLGALTVFPRPVLSSWHRHAFPDALGFYCGQPIPIIQLVWPDGDDRLPWEQGCDPSCSEVQPRLWSPPRPGSDWGWTAPPAGWSFPLQPDEMVTASPCVAFGGVAPTVVAHDEEGEWEVLGGDDEGGDLAMVHAATLVARHPDLADLADLPAGWEAFRRPGGPWHREPLDDEDL